MTPALRTRMPAVGAIPLLARFLVVAMVVAACGGATTPTAAPATASPSAAAVASAPPSPPVRAATPAPSVASPTPAPTATATPVPTPTASPTATPTAEPDDTWLVMLYQNADDEILEKDIVTDLNEAELVGSSEDVTIVAQLDRFDGAFDGDGDWTSARRYLVGQDDDLAAINSEELEDLGEVDSGDWQTLADFAVWAIETHPARKYALILSDHGAGWVGGWNDNAPREGSSFTTDDIDRAMRDILERTGVGRLDLIGFDACLMSQVESLAAVTPYARVAVASEEVEPALGWAYRQFLADLVETPAMDAEDLGRAIVESYIVSDARITDDDARSALLADFGYEGPELSAAEVAESMSSDVTLTATALDAVLPLNAAVNGLAVVLAGADQELVAEARAYSQAFETVFDEDQPQPYIDLGHFAALLQEALADDEAVVAAAGDVLSAIGDAVIAEKHGPARPGATGFTIFFPNSVLFEATAGEDASPGYTATVSRFSAASLWDDFLRFHYTGEEIDPDSADASVLDPIGGAAIDPDLLEEPAKITEAVTAPGAGDSIRIAPVTASDERIGVNDTVTLSTEITGDNVAFVYLYVSYLDEASGSYLTADMEFVGADETKEVDGVFYPDWGEGGVGELEVDWEPTVYFMSNGEQEEFAFFKPQTYGATAEEDTYTVRGLYTFTDTGNQREALMTFGGDGLMQSVFAFANEDGTGALREITPTEGDTFTILEEWLDFDRDPDGEFVDYEGGTLTFAGKPFEVVAYEAFPGRYTLGILVEDMDGNQQGEFVEVTVTE